MEVGTHAPARRNYRIASHEEVDQTRAGAIQTARKAEAHLVSEGVESGVIYPITGSRRPSTDPNDRRDVVDKSTLLRAHGILSPLAHEQRIAERYNATDSHAIVTTKPGFTTNTLRRHAATLGAALNADYRPGSPLHDFVLTRGDERVYGKVLAGPHLLPPSAEPLAVKYAANGLDGGFPVGFANQEAFNAEVARISAERGDLPRTVIRLDGTGSPPRAAVRPTVPTDELASPFSAMFSPEPEYAASLTSEFSSRLMNELRYAGNDPALDLTRTNKLDTGQVPSLYEDAVAEALARSSAT